MTDHEIAIFAMLLALFCIYDVALSQALTSVKNKAAAHVGALCWTVLAALVILLLMAIGEAVVWIFQYGI